MHGIGCPAKCTALLAVNVTADTGQQLYISVSQLISHVGNCVGIVYSDELHDESCNPLLLFVHIVICHAFCHFPSQYELEPIYFDTF